MKFRSYDPDCTYPNFAQYRRDDFYVVVDRLFCLAVNLTGENASNLCFEIAEMLAEVESRAAFDRILFFHQDELIGLSRQRIETINPQDMVKIAESAIQIWNVRFNAETEAITLERVTVR